MKKILSSLGKSLFGAGDATEHPWLAAYPAGVDWHAEIPETPVFDLIDRSAARFADRCCVNFLGKAYSYAEIGDQVNRAAKGFQQLGVKKGVKVGLCLPNTPYSVICYYAILKAGGTVVNFNPLYVERELALLVEESGTEIMVTLDLKQIYPKVAALLESTRLRCLVVCLLSDALPPVKSLMFSVMKRSEIADIPDDLQHVPFVKLLGNDGVVTAADIDPKTDIAVLQFTGGTTGVPKAAMLTHASIVANTHQVRPWVQDFEDGSERILGVLPLFHVFAMTLVMSLGVATGSELVLLPRFELGQVLETIDKSRITILMGVPTIFTALNSCDEIDKYDLTSLKYCISGGAPLLAETARQFEKLTGSKLVEGYGLSECSPVATCNPMGGAKEGSIGLPLPRTIVEIRALDKRRKLLPSGEKGEVCITGPQVMAGYWRRPEDTAETIIGGRLHTGDIGYMDADGFVFLVDRIKDVILCGGYNVYPRKIEEAIMLHPAVAEVAVIGVPDEYRGEQPKAFVALRNGDTLSEGDLLAFLDDKLSKIERPSRIEFREELPKTLIGKHSKKELAEQEAMKSSAGEGAA